MAVAYTPCVELQRMPHAAYIRRPGEDWAGITNPKERKRLQNRLNKRVSRQRKKRKTSHDEDDSSDAASRAASTTPDTTVSDTWTLLCSSSRSNSTTRIVPSTFSHCSEEDAARERAVLEQFAEQALRSYMTGDPCADHKLRLIQFNIINGLTRNAAVLGYQFDWLVCAAVSPFGRDGPIRDARSVTPPLESGTVPSNLVPTVVQLSIRHHPWLDLFPLPRMRDNLLLATKNFLSPEEEQELFDDIMDSGRGKHEWTGLVVWGEPWDPQNWEVSKPFLERWAWLMIGCPEILESTNRWRRLRGEKPLSTPGFIVEEVEDGD